MSRWSALGLGGFALVCACGPGPRPSVIQCDDARSYPYRVAQRPEPWDRTGPVLAGESLPIYEATEVLRDADGLAHAAMALACEISKDRARAGPELFDWAEEAATIEAGELASVHPFGEWIDLGVEYRPGDLAVELEDDQRVDFDPRLPPDAVIVEGIGLDAARRRAERVADRLLDLGLIGPGGERPLSDGERVFRDQTRRDEAENTFVVHGYLFRLGYEFAGIPLSPPVAVVWLDRDGGIQLVKTADEDVVQTGTAVTTIGEAEATTQFAALVAQRYDPDTESTKFDDPVVTLTTTAFWTGRGPRAWSWIEVKRDGEPEKQWENWALSLVTPDDGLVHP